MSLCDVKFKVTIYAAYVVTACKTFDFSLRLFKANIRIRLTLKIKK